MARQRPRAADLAAQLPPLEPVPTAAERAAERLREAIFQGRFPPGTPLPEAALAAALQVSRNTVREAFRLLISENLLSYEMHRGVLVRRLSEADVRDIYAIRRDLELAGLAAFRPGQDTSALTQAVEDGEREAAGGRWREVATANLRFHEQIVAFLQSPRRSRFFRGLMAEQRLGFPAVPGARAFHEPYLRWNRAIRDLLVGGQREAARQELERYLAKAEAEALAAVRDREGAP